MRLVKSTALAVLLPVAAVAAPPAAVAPASPAPIAHAPASDVYHGVTVQDPQRWLENGDAPDVKAFIDAHNTSARGALDKLPGRAAIRARLAEILGTQTPSYRSVSWVGGQVFALKTQPPKQHPFLVAMPSPHAPDKAHVVLDPDAIDPTGKSAIDFYKVSPDGKLVAASVSSGGSETGDVHVFDVATGKPVGDLVPRVNAGTAGGAVAWLPDSKGFYYTRYPRGTERGPDDMLFYVQLYRHMLGTPTEADTYEIGRDFPRIAEVFVQVDGKGRALVTIQKGDGGEFAFFLREAKAVGKDGKADWKPLATFEDRLVQGFFGEHDDLYLISRKDAPRGKLLHASLKASLAKAETIVPEGKDTLVSDIWADHPLAVADGRIYTTYQTGGPSEIRVFDTHGKSLPAPTLLPVSAVGDLVPGPKGAILFPNTSFVAPVGWYLFEHGKTVKTKLSSVAPVDLSKVTVLREMATSKDGTQVPVNILLPPGVAPGSAIPFVATGYGGYGINMDPGFDAESVPLLEHGVGVAVANLRGGAEFGDAWHKAGSLTQKQNVFDDMVATIELLTAHHHAAPGKVAITGASNGGLLMGAVLTQRPELVNSVASLVGIYDSLRTELEPNGAFNVTEFGTVQDKAQFEALYAYSPYHHVQAGKAYPPVLFITGANDVRVAPWHSRKMTAALEAAEGGAANVLLLTSFDAGHGIGSSLDRRIDDKTDVTVFLLSHLGVGVQK